MSNQNEEIKEIETEVEVDDIPFVEFDISVTPTDSSLALLSDQLENGDIIIPFYQRNYVWKIEQASKLIESFIIGLPVPQIFLYVNDNEVLEVIDGQQRLKSIKYFMEGYFGEAKGGKRNVFRLKGLSEASSLNGKTFLELDSKDQRKLRNSTLRAIHIKQLSPSKRTDCVFHIFERLNTGGTQLRPQEIRNAVYRGEIVSKLQELNQNNHWKNILRVRESDKHLRDMEFILRIFSLFETWEDYEKPMVRYLNVNMSENREFNSPRANRFFERFPYVVKQIDENIPDAFRPRGKVNMAVMDSIIVTLLESDNFDYSYLNEKYQSLLANSDYLESASMSTADSIVLKKRFLLAREHFANV
ncbi:GmrSD restriction endonuclease domain-containing protein [Cedecea neteri]|uniref:GmrSD restriction endonuclease domain-containing protein n=1 Tax=Cedecea neteri TaxID=158822 RepID=UPI0004F74D83|nr:DUF262 domain-containing protein [Cedecea neteri]AIR66395.1 hypothetical protein LH86_15245 [Cedecea neteri]